MNFAELYPNISNDVLTGIIEYEAVEKDCIHNFEELFSYIKNHSNATLIWFGFEDYFCFQNKNYGYLLAFNGLVDRINLFLNDMLKEGSLVDFKRLIATVGIKNAYDFKGMYRWNAPYSKDLIRLMADEVYKRHLIASGNTKKCLVLDCDNVLWGGILSEDGIEGIQIGNSGLGRSFQDFQRYILNLHYHGVILAICSKNEESDVLRVFKNHTGMLLKDEHIACFRCNWENKPDNIMYIAESLNIGLDSVVFIDDSIFEIESVNTMLPEITAVLYHRESVYDKLSCFNLKSHADLKTLTERTITYKTNRFRSEIQKKSLSHEDYISSLKMSIDIHKTKDYELARVAEITQRTNQCTNGVRYTTDHIKMQNENEHYEMYSVCLSDRFSDLGIVGVIGINKQIIDLFALSCRALSRGVESQMMEFIKKQNATKFTFTDTGKNERLKMMFLNNNLSEMNRTIILD